MECHFILPTLPYLLKGKMSIPLLSTTTTLTKCGGGFSYIKQFSSAQWTPTRSPTT